MRKRRPRYYHIIARILAILLVNHRLLLHLPIQKLIWILRCVTDWLLVLKTIWIDCCHIVLLSNLIIRVYPRGQVQGLLMRLIGKVSPLRGRCPIVIVVVRMLVMAADGICLRNICFGTDRCRWFVHIQAVSVD